MQLSRERVREIRKALGLTQRELGLRMGSPSGEQVRRWEAGRAPCQGPPAVLLALLEKLSQSVAAPYILDDRWGAKP